MQPVSGENYTTISGGVGTTVVSNIPATLHRVVIPGTYVGTLEIHDAPSAAGTTASSQVLSFGLPTITYPTTVEVGAAFKEGIVYEATGTPVMTLVWGR